LSCIPIVIVSIIADQIKGISLGASAVLQKPVSRNELQNLLKSTGFFSLKSDGSQSSILVVDDDRSAVDILAGTLKSHNYIVERAYGGREAIEIVHHLHPDLILLDLMMPEISGFDVMNTLKENPETANIPIIIITAKVLTVEERHQLNGHVTRIIEKSNFNNGCFINEVRRGLSLQRQAGI